MCSAYDVVTCCIQVLVFFPWQASIAVMRTYIGIGVVVSVLPDHKNGVKAVSLRVKPLGTEIGNIVFATQPDTLAHYAPALGGGGPIGAHFSRYCSRNTWELSAPGMASRAAHCSSCKSMSASNSMLQPNGLLKYQNQFEPKI